MLHDFRNSGKENRGILHFLSNNIYESKVRSQKSEIRNQKSEVRSQQPRARSQVRI
ncbi:MAG: hypothetical protein PHG58_09200 [Clostridia bacterium]|nr:hypothetical protein [Clostridia bacterium]